MQLVILCLFIITTVVVVVEELGRRHRYSCWSGSSQSGARGAQRRHVLKSTSIQEETGRRTIDTAVLSYRRKTQVPFDLSF